MGQSTARRSEFTIFLVDDDDSVRKAISRLLEAVGYATIGYASPADYLADYDERMPGCAIVDLTMSEMNGLQLQEVLLRAGLSRPIVFLSGTGDIPASVRALKAGAVDFLTKPVNKERLFAAVAQARDIEERLLAKRLETRALEERLALLTPREVEVLHHVISGQLNKQIAARLGTVEKTIKVHRGRVMAKLGVRCVADLVRLTDRAGIAPMV